MRIFRNSQRAKPSAGPLFRGELLPSERSAFQREGLFSRNFSPKTGPVWGFFQKDPAWGLFQRDRSAVRLFSGNPLLVGPAPPSGGGCTDAALIPRGTARGRGGSRFCSRAHPSFRGVPGLRLAYLRSGSADGRGHPSFRGVPGPWPGYAWALRAYRLCDPATRVFMGYPPGATALPRINLGFRNCSLRAPSEARRGTDPFRGSTQFDSEGYPD